jgi:hypothetical protein
MIARRAGSILTSLRDCHNRGIFGCVTEQRHEHNLTPMVLNLYMANTVLKSVGNLFSAVDNSSNTWNMAFEGPVWPTTDDASSVYYLEVLKYS